MVVDLTETDQCTSVLHIYQLFTYIHSSRRMTRTFYILKPWLPILVGHRPHKRNLAQLHVSSPSEYLGKEVE